MRAWTIRHGVAWAAVSLAACSTLPPLPPRTATYAAAPDPRTPLAARVADEGGGGRSGVRLLADGEEALAALLVLADAAQRTLDLQYYAVFDEPSSRALLERVRAAAQRGVRVRLLVDDLNTAGTDALLLALDRHERIEVRLYNPMPSGRARLLTKVLGSLHEAPRINSRMHNKLLVADNVLAVTGGRNLGDVYFLSTPQGNFVDLDVLAAGPVVPAMSRLFDRFWNSELAYPVEAVAAVPAGARAVPAGARAASGAQTGRAGAQTAPAGARAAPAGAGAGAAPPTADGGSDEVPREHREAVARHRAHLERTLGLAWAPARLIADEPSKSRREGEPQADETMFDDLGSLLRSARQEVLIVSPYIVPGEGGLALLRELRARGVRVRILTASMAGTDVPVVHAGYARYRPALLRLGVELYELRPEFAATPRHGGVHSRTNLHAKAVVVDGRLVLIGSMNMDPRSDRHNTEMGLLVSSRALAEALMEELERPLRQGSYRVVLGEDAKPRWRYVESDGRTVEQAGEPQVSWLRRLGLRVLATMAPEEML